MIERGGNSRCTLIVNSTITIEARARGLNVPTSATGVWQLWRTVKMGNITETQWPLFEGEPTADFKFSLDDWPTLFTPVDFFNDKSILLDGVDEYLNAGNNFNYDNANQWSLSMWIKPNNLTTQRCLYSKATPHATVWGWGL